MNIQPPVRKPLQKGKKIALWPHPDIKSLQRDLAGYRLSHDGIVIHAHKDGFRYVIVDEPGEWHLCPALPGTGRRVNFTAPIIIKKSNS